MYNLNYICTVQNIFLKRNTCCTFESGGTKVQWRYMLVQKYVQNYIILYSNIQSSSEQYKYRYTEMFNKYQI